MSTMIPATALPPAAAPGIPAAAGADPLTAATASLPALADFAALLLQQIGLQDDAAALPAAADDPLADDAVIATALGDLSALLPGLAALPAAPPGEPATAIDTPPGDAAGVQQAVLAIFLNAAQGLLGKPAATVPDATATAAAATGTDSAALPQAAALPPAIVAATEKAAGEPLPLSLAAADLAPADATLLTQAQAAAPARAERPADLPLLHIAKPVGARGWDADVGQRLVWMVGRDEGRAELTLTPPQLGRIEVSLTTSGDQTNALFVAASPVTRDALENALPRLRELLADAGITLGQASVSADSPREGDDRQAGGDNRGTAHGDAPPTADAPPWLQRGRGLIDTFA